MADETRTERKWRLNLEALELRISGLKYKEIGFRLGGVCVDRARQRVLAGLWYVKGRKDHPLYRPAIELYEVMDARHARRMARKHRDDVVWDERILQAAYPEDYPDAQP